MRQGTDHIWLRGLRDLNLDEWPWISVLLWSSDEHCRIKSIFERGDYQSNSLECIYKNKPCSSVSVWHHQGIIFLASIRHYSSLSSSCLGSRVGCDRSRLTRRLASCDPCGTMFISADFSYFLTKKTKWAAKQRAGFLRVKKKGFRPNLHVFIMQKIWYLLWFILFCTMQETYSTVTAIIPLMALYHRLNVFTCTLMLRPRRRSWLKMRALILSFSASAAHNCQVSPKGLITHHWSAEVSPSFLLPNALNSVGDSRVWTSTSPATAPQHHWLIACEQVAAGFSSSTCQSNGAWTASSHEG